MRNYSSLSSRYIILTKELCKKDLPYIETPMFAKRELEDALGRKCHLSGLGNITYELSRRHPHEAKHNRKFYFEKLEEGYIVMLKAEPTAPVLYYHEEWVPDFGPDSQFPPDWLKCAFDEKLKEMDRMFDSELREQEKRDEERGKRLGMKKTGHGEWCFHRTTMSETFRFNIENAVRTILDPPIRYAPSRRTIVEDWNQPITDPETTTDDSISPVPAQKVLDDDIYLRVRLIDGDGNPMDNIEVLITNSEGDERQSVSNSNGFLHLTDMKEGDFTIYAGDRIKMRLSNDSEFKDKHTLEAKNGALYELITIHRGQVTL